MAPKIERPWRSRISMRTLSTNLRNGVTGLPCRSVSTVRCIGDAGIAKAALLDRLAGCAVGIAVRHGASAENGAGGKRASLGRMRDQCREIERHVVAGNRFAERLAVDEAEQRQIDFRA